jgi:hypothetical protein
MFLFRNKGAHCALSLHSKGNKSEHEREPPCYHFVQLQAVCRDLENY